MEPLPFMLLRSGLFNGLAAERFAALLNEVDPVDVRAGEILFAEGDPADGFYVVVSGALEVFTTTEDAAEIVLARPSPGEHVGEQAVLAGSAAGRMASARGLADRSLVARIRADVLGELCERAPDLRERLMTLGARRREERLARRTDLVRRLVEGGLGEERVLRDGHVLYREGDPGGTVYVVLAGRVELFVDRDGGPSRVAGLGAGLCVGERDEETRAATAIVDGPSRVLEVARASFLDVRERFASVRQHLATLEKLWALPHRGFVTRHLDTAEGAPCVTQRFGLTGDDILVASFGMGDGPVRLAARGEPVRNIVTPDGLVQLGVGADGRICRIEARESVPLLSPLLTRAIEREPLSSVEEAQVVTSGTLDALGDDAILCTCLRVSRGTVRAVIQAGAADLRGIQDRTGCGSSCGSCVPGVLEMLGEVAWLPIVVGRVEELTPDVRRVHLARPNGQALPPARPGQHVVLRANVAGRRIERPYTLSGAAGAPWEVTVRREPGGVFSGWLFERATKGVTLEASSPRGDYVWDGGPAPIVCFVAGIGVTPALAFARTLLREGWPHRMVIDWSTRTADSAILGELASALPSNLSLTQRVTGVSGRIGGADVSAWVQRLPGAVFYLCGPEDYVSAVAGWLADAGVPETRVRVERFTPVGAPIRPVEAAQRSRIPQRAAPARAVGGAAVPSRVGRLRLLVDTLQAWTGA